MAKIKKKKQWRHFSLCSFKNIHNHHKKLYKTFQGILNKFKKYEAKLK